MIRGARSRGEGPLIGRSSAHDRYRKDRIRRLRQASGCSRQEAAEYAIGVVMLRMRETGSHARLILNRVWPLNIMVMVTRVS